MRGPLELTMVDQGVLHGDHYKCPNCNMSIRGWTALKDGTRLEPGKAISLCVYCKAALQLLENGWAQLTTDEFNALPPRDQNKLLVAGAIVGQFRREQPQFFDPIMAPVPKNKA